jgi:hypothetical protein
MVRRKYRHQPAGLGRAEALEAATRDYIARGYEITGYEAFVVQLKAPRRFQPVSFALWLAAAYLVAYLITTPITAAFLTALLVPLQLVWELGMKPQRTVTLRVDDAGQVTVSE